MMPIPWPKLLSIPNMRAKLEEQGYSDMSGKAIVFMVSLILFPILVIYSAIIALLMMLVFGTIFFVFGFFYSFRVAFNVIKLSCI